MDLKLPDNTIIGLVRRRRNYLIPNGGTVLCAGDMLKIFTTATGKENIKAAFTP